MILHRRWYKGKCHDYSNNNNYQCVFYLRHRRTCGALWSTHRPRSTCPSWECPYGNPCRNRSSPWPIYNPGHRFERVRPGRPWQRSVHRRVPITSHLSAQTIHSQCPFNTKSRQVEWRTALCLGRFHGQSSSTLLPHGPSRHLSFRTPFSHSHARAHNSRVRRTKKNPTLHTGLSVTWW